MELNLHTIPINDTAVLARLVSPAEESGDIVVPDSLPDIVRIVETDARVELRSKEVRGGKVYAEANAAVNVIYVPETGGGLCRLVVSLPFAAVFDLENHSDQMLQTVLTTQLQQVSSRELNPRKITVRAAVNFVCTVYVPRETFVRTGTENEAVECLTETRRVRLTDGIYEKILNVTDSIELPGEIVGEPEIIRCETAVLVSERKQIKNKVVLKGTVAVSMLLVQDDAQKPLCSAEASIPFAGVIDCIGVEEDTTVDLCCTLSRMDLKIVRESGTDRPLLAAKLELLTMIEAWSEREITYLADAYGVGIPISCECEEMSFSGAGESVELQQNYREEINCGIAVRRIYFCSVETENASVRSGEDGCEAVSDGRIRLILEAEDGGIYALTKSITLSAPVESFDLVLRCVAVKDKSFHISSGETVEVRFTVLFRLDTGKSETIRQISRIELLPTDTKGKRVPALTLCCTADGESLWQLGKRMGARVAEIRAANAMNGDELPVGKLLLVPRTAVKNGRN